MKYKETNLLGEEYELEIVPNPINNKWDISKNSQLTIHFYLDNFYYLKDKKFKFESGEYNNTYTFKSITNKKEFAYHFYLEDGQE